MTLPPTGRAEVRPPALLPLSPVRVSGSAAAAADVLGMLAVPVRAVLLALAVLAVGVLALVDSYPWSGPVLLTLSETHGVHAADLPVVALTGLSLLLLGHSARQGLVATA